MNGIATFLFSAIRVSTPLVYAAIAAVITQQAGLLNMAVESMMLSAALAGVMISGATQSAFLGVLGGVFFAVCKSRYKESFGSMVQLISDEDAATLLPEADERELDKVIDGAIDRVLARLA